jgi:hypothetical protein
MSLIHHREARTMKKSLFALLSAAAITLSAQAQTPATPVAAAPVAAKTVGAETKAPAAPGKPVEAHKPTHKKLKKQVHKKAAAPTAAAPAAPATPATPASPAAPAKPAQK